MAIKSAAHNFGHSFASTLNYRENDYVMSHLARAAILSGSRELRVDLLTGEASPEELLSPPVREAIVERAAWLPDLLSSHNIQMAVISAAIMYVRFMTEQRADVQHPDAPPAYDIPFECIVDIEDNRGKHHVGIVRDSWWVDEQPWSPPAKRRWW